MKLTLQKLKDMKPGQIIAKGFGLYPNIHNTEIKWLAKRGLGYHDWAIYYHLREKSFEYIEKWGDKMFTESIIKKLVPCDDEAFNMYRL